MCSSTATTNKIKWFCKIVYGIPMFHLLCLMLVCFSVLAAQDEIGIEPEAINNEVVLGNEVTSDITTVKSKKNDFIEKDIKTKANEIKYELTLIDIILMSMIVVISIIFFNKKASKIEIEERTKQLNQEIKSLGKKLNDLENNFMKRVIECQEIKDLYKQFNDLKSSFAEQITECQEIKDLSKSIIEIEKKICEIQTPTGNIVNQPQISDYIPIEQQLEKSKIFWVGSPQNGVFKESDYEFYKCEIIPRDEGRAYFSFNEAPNIRRRFFENESERINNIAEFTGFADVNSSITNLKSPNGKPYGILKKNPNGEGWILESKAKIKFG